MLGFVAGVIVYLLISSLVKDEPNVSGDLQTATVQVATEVGDASTETVQNITYKTGQVKRVVDGDTLVAVIDGEEVKVRFSGIDTPESVGDYKDNPEFYGPEASAYAKDLLSGETIYLEEDVKPYDRYDRYLAYIWLTPPSDEDFMSACVNAIMIQEGYATWFNDSNNKKYATVFEALEKEAREGGIGLWQQ